MQQQQMTQIILNTILNKIKSISKQCEMTLIADTINKDESEINVDSYLRALDIIRAQLIKFRQLQDQYNRLESILQKAQANVRQKIAFEQQIIIQNETLKTKVEQIQIEKMQLLQNSKRTMKQLKKVNQELFTKLNSQVIKNDKNQDVKEDKSERKSLKTGRVHSIGAKTNSNAGIREKIRVNRDEELRQIVRTEYIQREQVRQLDDKKAGQYLQEFLDAKEHNNIEQNGNIHTKGGKTDREIIISKKKQRKIYSNSNLFNMLRSNRRHQQSQLKEAYLPKTQDKKIQTKKAKNKFKNINRSLWKDKIANKSVHSVTSMQPVLSHQETL